MGNSENRERGELPVDPPKGWFGSNEEYYRFSDAMKKVLDILRDSGGGYLLSAIHNEGGVGISFAGGLTKVEAEAMIADIIAASHMDLVHILECISKDPNSRLFVYHANGQELPFDFGSIRDGDTKPGFG